jgi:hypothetical protein
VTSVLLRGAAALPAAAIVLATVLVTPDSDRGLVVHIAVVGAVATVLLALLRALRRSLRSDVPSPFDQALERPRARPSKRVPQLARLEREVGMGLANAFDLHHRLRPTLLETADGLLSARRGIDFDTRPDAARAALGNDAWKILGPDRPAPTDRTARGADPASIDRLLTALEAL